MLKKQIEPLVNHVNLASPTMHGDELKYMTEAFETNWMSTVGKNIDEVELTVARDIGVKYAVGLSCGTSALHMATRMAGIDLYGKPETGHGALEGHRVFCSDMTFDATVNPVAYENGQAVFIDSEKETWNMSPCALEKAFENYPEVRLVIIAHLYGTPAKMDEILEVCKKHNAYVIEDAAESFGAKYKETQTGSFGKYGILSFNGNKIITGSSGGMLLTNELEVASKVRKWSTQSREDAPWYQHEELGYNYRMSNVIAGVVRGQLPHLEEHIAQKKAIYMRYKEAFKDLPVSMNPYDEKNSEPNFWLSCLLVNREAMCKQERTSNYSSFVPEVGKSCPTEILQAISDVNAEGRPIWKPMHSQPIYKNNPFVTASGCVDGFCDQSVDMDIFNRGLCLPSDNKMTVDEQERIIEAVRACFE